MSFPIAIPSSSRSDASLYVPVHKRTPASSSYGSWSSRNVSPSPPSSPWSSHHTLPTSGVHVPIYTPAELVHLAASPLAKLAPEEMESLRATVPEVVQTRKQRKALAWHARQQASHDGSHRRSGSRGSQSSHSESEEDRVTSWRRV